MRQNAGVLYILTCKCASRHIDLQVFDIRTSTSGLNSSAFSHFDFQTRFAPHAYHCSTSYASKRVTKNMQCFVHFDLKTCFSLQRRAIFRHPSFKKCSENMRCFVHFDLKMRFAPQQRAIFDTCSESHSSAPTALAS